MTISPTRQSFQASVEQVRSYELGDHDRTPAWFTPLDRLPLSDTPLPPTVLPPSPPAQSIAAANAAQASGTLSAMQLLDAALAAIAARDSELNAFVTVTPEEELRIVAAQLDAERAAGKIRGPLHGIPISVKDVIHAQGLPSTASSHLLAGQVAARDAESVRRLRAAGAIIMGKVQTHEFALGVVTPQSRNPHDLSRDPGGSSGGSAISVVTGMSLGSLGTDTRASIRVPSALCGAVGFKPTYGVIPTDGVITLSWSLDHVAPMAATVTDCALMYDALLSDPALAAPCLPADLRGVRIGVPASALEPCTPEVLAVFAQALQALRERGALVETCADPPVESFDLAVSMGLLISRCEAAEYHRGYGDLHANRASYTRPVYEQLDEAQQVSAVDYLHAQRGRAVLRERSIAAIQRYDALLMPTCPVVAPRSSEVENYFLLLSQNCILWSFIGVPAISVPCGRTAAGLPVGAQLVAAPFADRRLLSLAAGLEAALSA